MVAVALLQLANRLRSTSRRSKSQTALGHTARCFRLFFLRGYCALRRRALPKPRTLLWLRDPCFKTPATPVQRPRVHSQAGDQIADLKARDRCVEPMAKASIFQHFAEG